MPLDWAQLGGMINGATTGDQLGISVSLSADGNTMAIGAAGVNSYSGSVSVYDLIGTSWVIRGSNILGATSMEQFGSSISLSADGNTVAIGAPYSDNYSSSVTNSGSVSVYDWINSSWIIRGLIYGLMVTFIILLTIKLVKRGSCVILAVTTIQISTLICQKLSKFDSPCLVRGVLCPSQFFRRIATKACHLTIIRYRQN
jgi:hypothetical protein